MSGCRQLADPALYPGLGFAPSYCKLTGNKGQIVLSVADTGSTGEGS